MKFSPHSYQEFATQKIKDQPKFGLFLDMGMGKTVCALTAVSDMLYLDVGQILVIAPLRVAEDTWSRESQKWDHLKYLRISKILGSEKQRIGALRNKADIWIINRENVEWLVQYFGVNWPFDTVIIDELSSFKNPSSKRFRALRKVLPLIRRLVGLTGTPAPNGLMDLWSQIYLLDSGERLGNTITGYRDRYFTPGKRNQNVIFDWIPKPEAEKNIYAKISDICVSMSAKDHLKLPEPINNIIPVRLSDGVKKQYKEFERDLILSLISSDIVAINAAALTNKLLQFANGAVYDENHMAQELHSAKLEALEDVIEAANGKSVLVAYAYKHDLARLQNHFRVLKPRTLDGPKDITDWNSGKIGLCLLHPASGGHGLNLQDGGHTIVWFGLTWNLEWYQQFNRRLDRQGQWNTVFIHHLITEGTMDERVMRVLGSKSAAQNDLLSAVKALIQEYR